MNAEKRLTLHEEKEKLESELAGIPRIQQRLDELRQLLGDENAHDHTEQKRDHDEDADT